MLVDLVSGILARANTHRQPTDRDHLGAMKDSISGTVSTAVGSSGVTFSLFDPDRCILARLHFNTEQWGKVTSMSGSTPVEVQLLAPTLEKHLVRLVPAKGELLGGFQPAVVSVDGMRPHRCIDRDDDDVLTEEGRFAQAWKNLNSQSRTHLAYLLTPSSQDQNYPITPSDRDYEVAATVIQWLGSHVGRCFLENLGYTKSKAPTKIPSRADRLSRFPQVDDATLCAVRARIRQWAQSGTPRYAGALPTTVDYLVRMARIIKRLPSLDRLEEADLVLRGLVLDAFVAEGVNVPDDIYHLWEIMPLPKDKIESMVDR